MARLSNIRRACSITDEVFKFIFLKIRPGQTERELAGLIEKNIKGRGATLPFPVIVASGPNAYNLHNKPISRKFKKGEPIIIDIGVRINGYCSDVTRTVFLGQPKPFWKEIYRIVLNAQRKSLKKLVKERSAKEIDNTARSYIFTEGYGKNFIHTLGHAFGKEAHDGKVLGPGSKDILKTNDTVTVEPGIYIKGRGGVRIEDDVLIKSSGIEVLTKFPRTLSRMIIK